MKKKYNVKGIVYKLLFLAIILVLLLIIASGRYSFGSFYDFFYRHLEEISYYEDDVLTAVSTCEIQKVNGYTYYFDEETDDLCRKGDGQDEETLLSGVGEFLVEGNTLYYICGVEGIYCRTIGSENEKKVIDGDIYKFAMGKDVSITYDVNNFLYIYDKDWNKRNVFNVEKYIRRYEKKKYGESDLRDIYPRDMIYAEGHIILSYEKDVFIYSIEKNEMFPVQSPIDRKDNALILDIIKKGNKLYYLGVAYEYTDLYTRNDRIECKENGIYQVDVKNGKLSKVSDDCGFFLVCLNDELYVFDSGLLINKIHKVDLMHE